MKIAIVQSDCQSGNVEQNIENIICNIEKCSRQSADLAVFPEMSDTGYHMPTIVKTASTWEDGPFQEIAAAASKFNINVAIGLSEKTDKTIYNTIAVVGRSGNLVNKYRKTHLITADPICEQNYIGFGKSLETCELEGVRFGLMTCYDIRFPEISRIYALDQVDAIIVPAAFPLLRQDHWDILTRARAIENQLFLIASNRVGADEGFLFCGNSRIVDPYGVLSATCSTIDETIAIAEVDKLRINEIRSKMQIFPDRKVQIYKQHSNKLF
ncbi:nitrilase-related carbon-nitrogen hydrolase [Cerasicoccus fimbriatus]|uniref:nitrilase-related carbon-nitrogen hydrolase n=1 Tax=Cerasicoccus fimbriatus TaxID=3014554 RepID=UPI0022B38F8F|nr:nitrilase-related carbon-nitrogen hydrolase [Cerasicoccus sp. TK19100]